MKRNPNLKPLHFIEGLWDLQGHEYKPYRKTPFPIHGQMIYIWDKLETTLIGTSLYHGKKTPSHISVYGLYQDELNSLHIMQHKKLKVVLSVQYNNGVFTNSSTSGIRETITVNSDKTIMESLWETSDDGLNWYTWRHIVYTKAAKPKKEYAEYIQWVQNL